VLSALILEPASDAPLDRITVSWRGGRRGLPGELPSVMPTPSFSQLVHLSACRQRENLLRQIREKNETISVLLNQLRNTSVSTPISVNAARLSLKPTEREKHGEVLSWMERRHAVSTHASEKACVAYDTSQLEDDDMYSSSEDEDENDEDGPEKAVVRTTPTPESPRVSALPEEATPLGFLATFSSQWNRLNRRSPSPLGTDVFGIANKRYFQPSEFCPIPHPSMSEPYL
jgi:hypothetical protein